MYYYALAEELMDLKTSVHQEQNGRHLPEKVQGELFVLFYLISCGNTSYPKDISKGMHVSTARIATILNHLEKENLITRTQDPEDNRQIIVTLTETGREKVRRKRQEMLEKTARLLEYLGPEDAKEYIRIQKKIMNYKPVTA